MRANGMTLGGGGRLANEVGSGGLSLSGVEPTSSSFAHVDNDAHQKESDYLDDSSYLSVYSNKSASLTTSTNNLSLRYRRLTAHSTRLQKLFDNSSVVSTLTALDLSNNLLDALPTCLAPLSLLALDISFNQLAPGSLSSSTLSPSLSSMTKNLIELRLDNNKIESIAGLKRATNLEFLILSNNKLSAFVGFELMTRLKKLDLSRNQISGSLRLLGCNSSLEDLNLSGNPCTSEKLYSAAVCNFIGPSLLSLDNVPLPRKLGSSPVKLARREPSGGVQSSQVGTEIDTHSSSSLPWRKAPDILPRPPRFHGAPIIGDAASLLADLQSSALRHKQQQIAAYSTKHVIARTELTEWESQAVRSKLIPAGTNPSTDGSFLSSPTKSPSNKSRGGGADIGTLTPTRRSAARSSPTSPRSSYEAAFESRAQKNDEAGPLSSLVHSQNKKRGYLQVHGARGAAGQRQAAQIPVPPPLGSFVSGAIVRPPPLPVVLAGLDFEGKEMIEQHDGREDLDQDLDQDQDHYHWTSFGEADDPITPFALSNLRHNTGSNQAESDVGGGEGSNDDDYDDGVISSFSADWASAHEQAKSQFTKGSRYAEIIAIQKQLAEQIALDKINSSDIERASYDAREEGDLKGILAKLDAQASKRAAILQKLKPFVT